MIPCLTLFMGKIIDYALDLWYMGFERFPCGITRPDVAVGRFDSSEVGRTQRKLFDHLLETGFHRTPFQLIFPNQTAGLIKKLKGERDVDEAHVRFYRGGVISCELEYERMGTRHWHGHQDGTDYLEEIIENSNLPEKDRNALSSQAKFLDFGAELRRDFDENLHYRKTVAKYLEPFIEMGPATIVILWVLYQEIKARRQKRNIVR